MARVMHGARALPGDSVVRASIRKLSNEEAQRYAGLILRSYATAHPRTWRPRHAPRRALPVRRARVRARARRSPLLLALGRRQLKAAPVPETGQPRLGQGQASRPRARR